MVDLYLSLHLKAPGHPRGIRRVRRSQWTAPRSAEIRISPPEAGFFWTHWRGRRLRDDQHPRTAANRSDAILIASERPPKLPQGEQPGAFSLAAFPKLGIYVFEYTITQKRVFFAQPPAFNVSSHIPIYNGWERLSLNPLCFGDGICCKAIVWWGDS